jgi:rhodanese-related sulfurtransferase
MKLSPWMKILTLACLFLLLLTMPLLSACGGGTTTEVEEKEVITEEEADEFEIVKDAVAAYIPNKAGNIKAPDLNMAIAEGNAPYIVSLRSAEDYAKGHVPGAVNMKFSELTSIPEDEEVVVYCYTGQSGSFAAAVLGMLGYDVQNLRFGMSDWTTDPDVYVSRFDPATSQGDYDTETTANSGGSYSYPKLNNTTSNDEDDIIAAAAATVSPKYITAADLNMKIAEDADMTIVSVRSAEQYAKGHIPGAINIEMGSLTDNLNKIDPDEPVYVYCYTGHNAGQATALLQMLGYDAYSLKFGMCSWSSDPEINAGSCFDPAKANDFDIEK